MLVPQQDLLCCSYFKLTASHKNNFNIFKQQIGISIEQ